MRIYKIFFFVTKYISIIRKNIIFHLFALRASFNIVICNAAKHFEYISKKNAWKWCGDVFIIKIKREYSSFWELENVKKLLKFMKINSCKLIWFFFIGFHQRPVKHMNVFSGVFLFGVMCFKQKKIILVVKLMKIRRLFSKQWKIKKAWMKLKINFDE